VDRRVEDAAVNAIASGSQHNTVRAISHRSARSLSVIAKQDDPKPSRPEALRRFAQ
jgi:hypothetical protein